jgi:hypothetical protein
MDAYLWDTMLTLGLGNPFGELYKEYGDQIYLKPYI